MACRQSKSYLDSFFECSFYMKSVFFSLCFFFLSSSNYAHIGSPDIFYEGDAGPYKLQVSIQPPDVVPGTAKIQVQVLNDRITKISLQPIYYQYGSEGAPQADQATRLQGDEQSFAGELWLMAFGSASVRISLEGGKGTGNTLIPVSAMATATRKMDKSTEIVLIPLGILLFAGLVTIMGVAVSQAITEPGMDVQKEKKKRSNYTMAFFAVFLVGVLFLGKAWWDSVEAKYREYMYKPLYMETKVGEEDRSQLQIELKNRPWLERNLSDLVPDHGKLMHLFMVREDGQVFAHLHPASLDSSHYSSQLPPLAEGTYYLFADVVHENGLAETMMDSISLAKLKEGVGKIDPDDAWIIGEKGELAEKAKIKAVLDDTLKSKKLTHLTFALQDISGVPLQLEPYLGMAGHAVVLKKDRSVFIHLHPMGTVSMASQTALASKVVGKVTLCNPLSDSLAQTGDSLGLVDQNRISMMKQKKESKLGQITFPYSFPQAGEYWVWVQVKNKGQIITQQFEFRVN